MRRLLQILLLATTAALASTALAFDNGQYDDIPADIRAWFRNVLAPNGVPCCDISDGHRTEYDVRNGAYWVPIEGEWMLVPERAVHPRCRQSGRTGGGVVCTSPRQHHHQLLRAGGRGLAAPSLRGVSDEAIRRRSGLLPPSLFELTADKSLALAMTGLELLQWRMTRQAAGDRLIGIIFGELP